MNPNIAKDLVILETNTSRGWVILGTRGWVILDTNTSRGWVILDTNIARGLVILDTKIYLVRDG